MCIVVWLLNGAFLLEHVCRHAADKDYRKRNCTFSTFRLPDQPVLQESIQFFFRTAASDANCQTVGNSIVKTEADRCLVQSVEVVGASVQPAKTVHDAEVEH